MTTLLRPPVAPAPDPPSELGGEGWAERSLDASLHRALLWGLAAWQVVMVAAVVASDETADAWAALIIGHLLIVAIALLADRGLVALGVVFASVCVMLLADWAVVDSLDGVLCLATVWFCNLTQLGPALAVTGRRLLAWSLTIGVAVPVGFWLLHPDWIDFAVSLVFTGLAIRWVGRVAVRYLREAARGVDEAMELSRRATESALAAKVAHREAFEQGRILHDTVVNTLAALAAGGAAVRDVARVRERCASDALSLELLLAGEEVPGRLGELAVLAEGLGLELHRRGLDAEEVERLAGELPDHVVRALSGAVREALLNVSKHAGVDHVEVDVVDDDGLVVTVHDDGRGFDPSRQRLRGLSRSVMARAEAAGIVSEVRSQPGQGTSVELRCPTSAALEARGGLLSQAGDAGTPLALVRLMACWLWGVAVVLVGVAIEVLNQPGRLTLTYAALALTAVIVWLAWRSEREGRLPPAVTAAVVVGVPVVFLLALGGIGFGTGKVHVWQAIAVTPLLIVLLSTSARWFAVALGFTGLLAASIGTTVVVVSRHAVAVAAVIPVGTAAPLVVAAGWWAFARTVERMATAEVDALETSSRSRIEQARIRAASTARERWHKAGLVRSLDLLSGVADASLDPADETTRYACAREEAYVRQVMLLDPALLRMGRYLAAALASARDLGVGLVVRTGDRDVETDQEAAGFGALLEAAVVSVAELAPGGSVTVSLFANDDRLRFGLVAPNPVLTGIVGDWSPPPGWAVTVQSFDGLDVAEVVSEPLAPEVVAVAAGSRR